MTPEKRLQKDLNLDAMAENLLASDRPGSEISRKMLWAYALNALELPQREHVLQLVAQSETAQKTLERIEKSIAITAFPERSPLTARVLKRVERTLAAMGKDLSSVAAVIARVGDGLISVFDQVSGGPKEMAAVGLMLGNTTAKSDEEAASETARQRKIDVGEENGLRASVILTSGDLLDLHVVTPPYLNGQMVKLFELGPDGRGGEQAIQISMSRIRQGQDDHGEACGIATFTNCDMGIFRITAPEDRELTIWCV